MIVALAVLAYLFVGFVIVLWGEYRGWFPCECGSLRRGESCQSYSSCWRAETIGTLIVLWPVAIPWMLTQKIFQAAGRAREKNAKLASELKAEMAKAEREVEAMLKETS